MAVKIRLTRKGDAHSPFYRVVVADSRAPRDGKFIEILGTYNPLTDPAEIKINNERAIDWIKNGAQPTETVAYLIKNCNDDGSLNYKKSETVKLSKKAMAKKAAEEEARKQAEAEAAAKAAEEAAAAEAPAETEEAPAEA